MKAKLNFKSKRTIIIASIIAVLAVGAGVGGYFYAKGNNQSGATNVDNQTSQNSSQENGKTTPNSDNKKDNKTPDTNPDNGNANNNGEGNGNADNGNTPDNGNNNGNAANNGGTDNGNNANNGGTNNGNGANNGGNGNAADNGAQDAGDDTDATTVTETVTEENPWESHSVKWTPEALNVSTAKVDTSIPQLQSEKIAYVQGEEIDGTPDNTAVQNGEEITYVIKVKNTGDIDASKVMIYDTVPEGTVLKENAEGTVQTIKDADGKEIQRIVWEKDVKAGETIEVSFKVTVNIEEVEGEEIDSITLIENKATVNRKETNKTENPVITSNKVASLVVDEEATPITNDDFVKPGQTIRYTILVKNTSKVKEAITTITDTVPEGTTLVENSIDKKVVNVETNAEGKVTLEWKNVEVKANETKPVSFDVTVNDVTPAKIRNVATVGETDTPPTENDVYIDLDISKTWDDANNQDGKRPDIITVVLNKTVGDNTTPIKEATITAKTEWKYTFEDLPKYEGETEIKYTITENEVRDYETKIDGFSITNKHVPEKTEATVKKVWDDKDNQDGKRPASLTVQLKANGQNSGDAVTLNAGNEWTATVTDLDKYASGKEIAYTWSETEIPTGYTLTGNAAEGTVTTLTNTHVPETTEATIKKIWADSYNQDGKRPASLDVTLSNVTVITLSEDNKWTSTIEDLPKYANGVEIKYTWNEAEVPEGYTLESNTTNGTVTTITNKHTPELTDVTVKKVWADSDNQDGKRPANLTVTLSNGTEVKLNEENGWTATIKDLPVYNAGRKIEYTWTEGTMPEGYSLTDEDTQGYVTTLTNSYTPETTEATVKKVWDDNNNQDGKRPTTLTVTLSNGTDVTLNEGNKWTQTVAGLPKYEKGQLIKYTWTEKDLPDSYALKSSSANGTVTTITNTHTPEKTEASVKKVWDDADNQDGIRPTRLVVKLSNGREVTLNKDNNWEAKVENLPKYANGTQINYTWSEENVPDGYSIESNTTNGTITTITNKHTPAVTEASVKKVWNDNNDQDGKRPASLTVSLSNGTEVTLNEDNNWEGKVTGLPKYANGQEIEYTWSETEVPEGYTLESNTANGTVTTITNKHTPAVTEASVKKVWDDADNQDGIRPTRLVVKLSNGREVTLNKDNNWEGKVTGLPKYANGQEIEYTWAEENVPDGYSIESNTTNGTVTTITNKHTPAVTEATVKKVWDDNNDQDGKRPASLTVTLSNGTEVTLNEANKWEAKVENLPKYANGQEIAYTWTEETLTDYELTNTNKVGTVTTLTNKVLKPDISVTKKQYMYNADTEKYEEVDNGTEVRAGDEIVYLLTATNNGNKAGKTTIRDPEPANTDADKAVAWIDANENCKKDTGETTVSLSELNGTGYEVTVPANSGKVVIAYKVIVDGYANEEVTNTAYYTNEGEEKEEEANKTRVVKIEDDMEIVPTTSNTEQESVKQRVILVLDYSGSMEGARIEALKSTASSFIDNFLSLNDENEIMIIKYAKELINRNPYFTSDKQIAKAQLNTQPDGGTNIDAGLTEANKHITTANAATTSVILMTDGLPSRYIINSNGNCSNQMGTGSTYSRDTEKAANEAIESAGWIKSKGSKLYTIGFGLDDIEGYGYDWVSNSEHAKEIIRSIATPSKTLSDGTTKNYYHYAASGAELNDAFENIYTEITTNQDGEHSNESSKEGIITIEEGFTKGQDVEIYKGTYTEGSSTPYATFTWNSFLASGYATYTETPEEKITFNLGKYMEDKNMSTDEEVIIRFVAAGTAAGNTTNKARYKKLNLSSKALTLAKDIVEEEKTTDTTSKQEEKNDKIETNTDNTSTVNEEKKESEKEEMKELKKEENKSSDETSEAKEIVEEKENVAETSENESSKKEEKEESKETSEKENSKQEEVKQENEESKVQEEIKGDVLDDVNTKPETTEKE